MSDINSKIIGFFRECYESDNRGMNIVNIFSRKIAHIFYIDHQRCSTLINKGFVKVPTNESRVLSEIDRQYKREKKIIFASEHIVINHKNSQGKNVKYVAPLRYAEVKIDGIDTRAFAHCDVSGYQWNIPVLRNIIEGSVNWEELDQWSASATFGLKTLEMFGQWIAQYNKGVNVVISETKDLDAFKALSRTRSKSKVFLVHQGIFAVVDRSTNTRGIVHELEKLEKTKYLSPALRQMLSGSKTKPRNTVTPDFGTIPGVLSLAQQEVLKNAASKRLSQVIGPPGTGKSYTIANIAVDRFLNGEKVLIISQNEHAINVIQKQISNKLGISSSAVVRTGDASYHKQLKKTVASLLNNFHVGWQSRGQGRRPKPIHATSTQLESLRKKVKELENKFIRRSNAAVHSGISLDEHLTKDSFWKFWNSYKVRISLKRTAESEMLHETIDQLYDLYLQREKLVAELIDLTYENVLYNALTNYKKRQVIVKFHSALKARNSARQETLFEKINYTSVLDILPIWLSSLEGLHRALPLEKDLFDVVIIDEATQCDIASCLPALQRAKRIVVVGDPMQLRHLSFLSFSKQEAIRKRYGLENFDVPLNFREESMIDMINHHLNSSEDAVMLDEHYRSLPEIIQFSNEHFYGNRLRIMTERPMPNAGNPVSIIETKGVRNKGVNIFEAQEVMKYLRDLIARQEEIPNEYKLSIGVLSFFRDQAEYLQSQLLELPTNQIAVHQLRVGTPYSFQGEERDIMLISCALDEGSGSGVYQYLNRENMFNVAITRAKSAQVLFLSAKASKLPKTSLLYQYLNAAKQQKVKKHEKFISEDKYIKEVTTELRKREIKLIQNYSVAGVLMDVVAIYKGNCLAIDLIGFPGQYEAAFHLNRYKIFDRAGFSILPISLEEWKSRKDEIIARISKELNNKISSEKIEVAPQNLSDQWPLLLRFNPDLAKEVRLLELDLPHLRNDKVQKQLGQLVETYHKFVHALLEKLSEEEHTFIRYKEASDEVLQVSINNYKKIIALEQSVPGLTEDEQHPVRKLVLEQKNLIDGILTRNLEVIHQLQEMTIAWSRIATTKGNTEINEVLTQLKGLKDQIERYNN